jgi:hypothetical protein
MCGGFYKWWGSSSITLFFHHILNLLSGERWGIINKSIQAPMINRDNITTIKVNNTFIV